MSKTHKTKPLGVKVCQGLVGYTEEHDHRKGPCDLPKMTPDNAGFGSSKTNCYWRPNFYEPLSFCGCRICSEFHETKSVNKRNRHKAKRKTREWVKDLEAYDEEIIQDSKELW